LREIAKDLPYDFWVTLVGDTNKKLYRPYESWLMDGWSDREETDGQNGLDSGLRGKSPWRFIE
jgi:acyl-[acyl-carrier-protein] desaturase